MRWLLLVACLLWGAGASAQTPNTLAATINNAPAVAQPLAGSENFAITQSGVTKRITAANLIAAAQGSANSVATNAALAATLQISYPGGVWRLTYGNGNKAPPLWYQPQTGSCATNSQVGDNGSCVDVAADGNSWLAAVPDGGLDARQFGADPFGVVESSSALQKWGNWVMAATGRTGWLDAGTYSITTALSWTGGSSCAMNGAGITASKIIYSGASTTNSIVSITNTLQCTFNGWGVNSTTVMTAGAAIYFNNTDYSKMNLSAGLGGRLNAGVAPTAKLWHGIWFELSSWNSLSGTAYVTKDAVLANNLVELNIDSWINVNKGRAGVHAAGAVGGLYLGYVSVECINTGLYGLLIDNELTAGTNLQFFVSNRAVFDTCLTHNVKIDNTAADTTQGVRAISWEGWASGAGPTVGAAGIYVKNWHNGTIHLSGSATLISNQGSGMLIDDTTSIPSIDPAAVINGNAAYGVQCSVPMTNIIADVQNQQGTWNNILGPFSFPNCGGQLSRATWPNFTPVLTCVGGGAPPTATALGTSYRYGRKEHIHYDVTLTGGGTCVTSLNFSTPADVSDITGCAFHGMENTGKFGIIGISGTATQVSVFKYDGTLIQTNGLRFFFDGECQVL